MMKPSVALLGKEGEVKALIASFGYKNPRVFGSVARGEDDESSDLDILVDHGEETRGLIRRLELQARIGMLLGVNVDVKTPGWIPENAMDKIKKESFPL